MIASLTGNVLKRGEKYIILDVGGVGYKVYATPATIEYAASTHEVFLYIHTVVREDALELFGFCDELSLDMFERLTSISGIGPRSALSVLALASVEDLRDAIISADITYLTKVSGIGKKTAEKILIELKDILSKEIMTSASITNRNMDGDALEALESLGYSNQKIREALKAIPEDIKTTEEKIKSALKYLSK